ncbi:MAG TPA: SGNH/GDSL hydrolase family protein [Actinomycetes bacterium]
MPGRARTARIVAVALAVAAALLNALPAASAGVATPPARPAARQSPRPPTTGPAAVADPDRVLPRGWQASADRAVTLVGDETGLHVLVADAARAYRWRTAATLTEPGVGSEEWIGQGCVTGSGRRMVVVYEPRQWVNREAAFQRGAFAAVVDLAGGRVVKLAERVSIAYHDPGCGTGEAAVLSRLEPNRDRTLTRLLLVDAATGRVGWRLGVPGQVTSAVPYARGIAAARGAELVAVAPGGRVRTLAAATGVPSRLHPDAAGGLAYQVAERSQVQVRRLAGARSALLGTAPLGAVRLGAGAGGRVFLTGPGAARLAAGHGLPGGWRAIAAPGGAEVSTEGGLMVTSASTGKEAARRTGLAPGDGLPDPVSIAARVTGTGKVARFTVVPRQTAGNGDRAPSPLPGGAGRAAAGGGRTGRALAADPSTDPTDPDRACAVPRNDAVLQTYQPSPKEAEWAVDMAVQDKLRLVTRPAGQGLPAYSPGALFPNHALQGGGTVPAQVMLGVLAQESNMWQASPHVVDGLYGNFEQGGFYGNDGNVHVVDWANADCGYGAAQVTTGMRRVDTGVVYSDTQQKAIAVDYLANIAAGLQLLEDKWNQTRALGIVANGGDPRFVESWWFALWAYNSGVQPRDAEFGNTTGCSPGPSCTDNGGAGGNWGLGWANNPANPDYPQDRDPFLQVTYDDAKHPNSWSYPERVIGWAYTPLQRYDWIAKTWGPAYAPPSSELGAAATPPFATFCQPGVNHCTYGATTDGGGNAAGLCALSNFHCWWNRPATWETNCAHRCGTTLPVYPDVGSRPAPPGNPYPADCDARRLPGGAVIVDDVLDSVRSPVPCAKNWTSRDSFSLKFASATGPGGATVYPSKVDFHQVSAGFGGHFWFTHSRAGADATLKVTGTWTPPSTVTGWTRIKVHVPSHGAWTRQADYRIKLGNGQTRHRVVNQAWQRDQWVDIGVFNLAAGASVSLSSVTEDGRGEDVAFDAVAFIQTVKPQAFYVGLGDSYSAGEGNKPYDPNSAYSFVDDFGNAGETVNTCHRSVNDAYARQVRLPGHSQPIAQEAATGAGTAAFAFIACSGAITTSITDAAIDTPGQNAGENTDWGHPDRHSGEMAQVDQGYLDADTTLVSLTIGGNDVRFADILKGCIETLGHCSDDDFYLTHGGHLDPAPFKQYEPHVIRDLVPSKLDTVYRAVHAKAPNARIVVLGYPRLFNDTFDDSDPAGLCFPLNAADWALLNQFADLMSQTIASVVANLQRAGIRIDYVDPERIWAGHRACPQTSSSWVRAANPLGDSGMFHPYPTGQAAYASLVNGRLAGTS